MSQDVPELPGLQAERTELSWERSAFGLLASCAILLFRPTERLTLGRLILAVASLSLALLVVWFGRRRGRRTRTPQAGSVPDARVEVLMIGWSVAALAIGAISLIIF